MQKKWLLAIVSSLVMAWGCDDDVIDVSKEDVAEPATHQCTNPGEVSNGMGCVCDTSNHWKGTAGNCTCEEKHFPNGNSCIPEQDVGKCTNTGEVYDGTRCVCDTANNWEGNPGSCGCASGYELNANACTQIQCRTGEILSGATCMCNTAGKWKGSAGSCTCEDGFAQNGNSCIPEGNVGKCTNQGEVYDGLGCVCDTANYWEGTPGSCTCKPGFELNGSSCTQIQCGTGEIMTGGSCNCNTAAHWIGSPRSCTCASGYEQSGDSCVQIQCGKGEMLIGSSCACDTLNHWTGEIGSCTCETGYTENGGICENSCGKGETMSGSSCICDANAHWTGEAGSCVCADGYTETNGKCLENITNSENCLNIADPAPGKICLFGKYMQTAAGNDMTDLEWQILKIGEDNSLMMISRRVIDVKPYHTNAEEVTWEKSTMRSWLNGLSAADNLAGTDYSNDNFFQKAFNETEQQHVKQVTVSHPGGPMQVSGGPDTQDRVFLLSYSELMSFFPSAESRQILTTEYAKNLKPNILYGSMDKCVDGRCTAFDCSGDDCRAYWLTRTPGDNLQRIIRVYYTGFVCPHGTSVNYSATQVTVVYNGNSTTYYVPSSYQEHGVRPVIWIQK